MGQSLPKPGEPCPVCERPMPKLTRSQRLKLKLKLLAKEEAAQDRKRRAKARAMAKRRLQVRDYYVDRGLPVPEELAGL